MVRSLSDRLSFIPRLSLPLLLLALIASAELFATSAKEASFQTNNQRKALVIGRGLPLKDANGGPTHPQGAKNNFLALVGNPANDPRKGWTCDLSYDLMKSLGMDPNITSYETLFEYIGKHHLGYRIVMENLPAGQGASFWGSAVNNGMMPFAPHFNNTPGLRYDDQIGIKACVSVGGGVGSNAYSYGPSLEFYDALPRWMSSGHYEDAAESWSNQALAARYSRILDAHPGFNIWDARQFMRQAASHYTEGWSEREGFGRVNEKAVVTTLLPGAPVEFWVMKSRDERSVLFTWRNFLQSDFASTVIARKDGRVIYDGNGTNSTWLSDVDGDETFKYWSRNRAGVISRFESNNIRAITGLSHQGNRSCLVLGAAGDQDFAIRGLHDRFKEVAPRWICDIVYRAGNPAYDAITNFPSGDVVAVLPDYPAMVSYTIEKKYRMLIVSANSAEKGDLYGFKSDWDRAASNGIAVVLPHHYAALPSRVPSARRESPPRLFSAIVVGGGSDANEKTYGPGLEFFDFCPAHGQWPADASQKSAAAHLAGKLARVLDANPSYNLWDARQHLRQSASLYAGGWTEKGGYGRPPEECEKIAALDSAPPLEIQAVKSPDGKSVSFSWENFPQSSFAGVVIVRKNGGAIYEGAGTNYVWKSDVAGDEIFTIHSKNKSGGLSKPDSYTVMPITGLTRF